LYEKCYKVDIKVISSANKELKNAIKDESFRKDLYYRLNVITIYFLLILEKERKIYSFLRTIFCKNIQKNGEKIIPL